jgi:hypothetical protein
VTLRLHHLQLSLACILFLLCCHDARQVHKLRRGTGDGETATVAPKQIHRGPTGPAHISDEQRTSEKIKQLHRATSKRFMMLIAPKKTWFLSSNHHEPPRPLTKASEKAQALAEAIHKELQRRASTTKSADGD